jgi:fumarate hydratase class II
MGQSSNDVFPSAIHVAALKQIEAQLRPALEELQAALERKSGAFRDIVKTGRTHLQDATPLRLGQEFSAFASQIEHGLRHLAQASEDLRELPLGGTAVGTGINTHPEFGSRMAGRLAEMTGLGLIEAPNHFEAQAARDGAVRTSGALKALAVSLIKMAGDIRLLASGPRMGLGELRLPEVQPGSSIMPGKVNPVIAEAVIQAAAQVIGNDAAIALGGALGHLQLNDMQPLIARNLLEQIQLLGTGSRIFSERLIAGLTPNREHIAAQLDRSLALATALAPRIGYDRAAELAQRAAAEGKTIADVAKAERVLPQEELDRLLSPDNMTGPQRGPGRAAPH